MAYAEKRGKGRDGRMRYRGRYKRPDGTWGSVSKDDLKQPFYKAKSAREYAAGLETDVRRKTFIDPGDGQITVGRWATVWIESIEVDEPSDDTYRQRLRTVILPRWEDVVMRDVVTVAVSTWEKELRAKYAAAYVKSIMSVFRTMMEDAVASKVIGTNPVPERKARRRGKFEGAKQEDTTVLATPRQALLLARNAETIHGLNGYTLVLTIAYAGLRIAEVVGLRREHLQLEDTGQGARLLVQEQHRYRQKTASQVPPKYGSTGSLILPPFLAELLQRQLDSHDKPWVFTTQTGLKLWTSANFYTDLWRPWVDGRVATPGMRGPKGKLPTVPAVAGIENIVPHGLRHSHKVWLDEGQKPRVAVEERMRHRMQGVEATYSHTTLPMERDIEAYLQGLWEASVRVKDHHREWESPRPPRKQTPS